MESGSCVFICILLAPHGRGQGDIRNAGRKPDSLDGDPACATVARQ
jgi:hypothetical protein